MNILKLVSLFFLSLLVTSCKKKNPENKINNYFYLATPDATTKISLPITKNSYWVYTVDVVEVTTLNRIFIEQDSIVAEKDSVINGRIFTFLKKYVTKGVASFQPSYSQQGLFRDSSGFNITPSGAFFNQGDFQSTTYNSIPGGSIEFQLKYSTTLYAPYGAFPNCINWFGKFQPQNLSYSHQRNLNNYFSDGIGLVQSTGFYVNDPNHFFESNLIRYKIF